MQYKKIEVQSYREIMDQYHIGSLLAKVLAYYQWDDCKISDFLCVKKGYDSNTHQVAINIKERIEKAKIKHEKVFVFGDYDTDGICATTMMVKLLKELGIEVGFYIPNRLEEGYGLNVERTKQAIEKGYQLIITVDNGVKAYDALLEAKNCGVDVIVVDHHTLEDEVDCLYLWHPSMIDVSCQYLCGAGCVLQLVKLFGVNIEPYLALAAVATIGDMMVLEGENRWIVQQGLRVINEGKHMAFRSLIKNAPINEEDISFTIVPKLNAIGRLADRANANQLVHFLLCEQIEQVERMALQIQALNDERKKMTVEHEEWVDEKSLLDSFMIVKDERFHPGIVGLLANRLCKTYQKPVMVLSEKEDCYVGSVRSIDSLNLMEYLPNIADKFVAFGGHKQAAGITFKKEALNEISTYLQSISYEKVEEVENCLMVDEVDLQWSNIQELFAYGPFGQGVQLPCLWYKATQITNYRYMKKETYLKWQFPTIEATWFSTTNTYQDFVNEADLVFIGKLGKNVYRGMVNYVLQVQHVIK
ncbi:MAG: DHH family phosphoesterase [Erysipelotrichaceae bacterium]|nr:DHH family phosphoesterase [Erysipelotrichaceae bacterium]